MVLTKECTNNKNTYKLERETLSKGMYFLEIKTEEDKWIRRVVIQ